MTCFLDPLACINDTYTSLVAVVPWVWVFWSFLLGSIFGAMFGWLGVVSTVVAFLGGFFARGGAQDAPPPPLPKPPVKKRKTLF
jgi:hypothetical protein